MHARKYFFKRSQQFRQLLRRGEDKIRWSRQIARGLERLTPRLVTLIAEDQVKSLLLECLGGRRIIKKQI